MYIWWKTGGISRLNGMYEVNSPESVDFSVPKVHELKYFTSLDPLKLEGIIADTLSINQSIMSRLHSRHASRASLYLLQYIQYLP